MELSYSHNPKPGPASRPFRRRLFSVWSGQGGVIRQCSDTSLDGMVSAAVLGFSLPAARGRLCLLLANQGIASTHRHLQFAALTHPLQSGSGARLFVVFLLGIHSVDLFLANTFARDHGPVRLDGMS